VSWIDDLSTTELVIGAVVIGGALGLALRDRKGLLSLGGEPQRCGYSGPAPQQFRGVPFASGGACPRWPVVTNKKHVVSYKTAGGAAVGNWARRFGADRGSRYHAGIDIYANAGDPIVAAEGGRVVAFRTFFHGTWALYLCTNSGITLNYGEIAKNSWREFGIQRGSVVVKGQPLGRIGLMSGGSHMLHFETYRGCVDRNRPWYKAKGVPSTLLNPTKYLLRARDAVAGGQV
jgi:murein DD-endopeptidase MepM/ murein hydrolase activator NlpD